MPRAFAPHAGRRISQPLNMRRDLDLFGPASPQDYFYHQDDLFNVVALTNAAGAIVERVTYGDYGFPTINDVNGAFAASESTVGNPFLFTGREWANLARVGAQIVLSPAISSVFQHLPATRLRGFQPDPRRW